VPALAPAPPRRWSRSAATVASTFWRTLRCRPISAHQRPASRVSADTAAAADADAAAPKVDDDDDDDEEDDDDDEPDENAEDDDDADNDTASMGAVAHAISAARCARASAA
jgi:hypothetical protein